MLGAVARLFESMWGARMTQGHVLIAGGTSLSFDVVGAGPDVVLLHAGIADIADVGGHR